MDTKVFLKGTSSSTVPFPWEGLSGRGFTINYVWNPDTLAFEVQEQAAAGGGGGDASAANQVTGNASLSALDTNLGAKADSAASSDTGTFSLIALVKRLLQSLTTISGNTLKDSVATSACTNVSAAASTTSILASTAGRRAAFFYNDSTSDLFLKLGATASTTSFTVKMPAYSYYEIPQPVYTGAVDGIWTTATGSVRITEMT